MKMKELEKVIAETPLFVPMFRVTKVPYWAQELVAVGDFVVFYNGRFYTKSDKGLHLGVSYIEFVDYMTWNCWTSFSVKDILAFHPAKEIC